MDVLADRKGEDVLLLDIQGLSVLADHFVICSGTSARQLRALLSSVREETKAAGVAPPRVEGEPSSGWILMDYGGVVVHLFSPEIRAFYDLEDLWRDGRVVVRIQ